MKQEQIDCKKNFQALTWKEQILNTELGLEDKIEIS